MKYCSIVILLILFSSAFGQKPDSVVAVDKIALAVSVNHETMVDQLGSPLSYSGSLYPITIRYNRFYPDYDHTITFFFALSGLNGDEFLPKLNNDRFHRTTFLFDGNLSYRYLRTVDVFLDKKITVKIGGTLDNIAQVRRYTYSGNDFFTTGGIASWDGASMLEASAQVSYDLTPNIHTSASLSIPIISAIIRPAFDFVHSETSVFKMSDIHIVPIGGMGAYIFSIGAGYDVGEHLTVEAEYLSRFYRYERYGWISSWVQQGGDIAIGWRF